MVKFTSKLTLAENARDKMAEGKMEALKPVVFSTPILSGVFTGMSQKKRFDAISGMTASSMVPTNLDSMVKMTGKYGSGFNVPMMFGDGKESTVAKKLQSGIFMSSNTLPVDWQSLFDAIRIDVTTKKAINPLIRGKIYDIKTNPNYTRTLKPTEMGSASIYFEENNGHGQAVPQGEILGGANETFDIKIYGAGFTWDLLGELFSLAITPDELSTALIIGENAFKDDLAIAPIINFTYAAEALTAPNAQGGAQRQELLYNTLIDGRNDMRKRFKPGTTKHLNTNHLLILASDWDAENIMDVIKGLPSVQDKTLHGISQIKEVISYEGESIDLRDRTITYEGVPEGTAFMLIPASQLGKASYMNIAVKHDLVVETDAQPNVNNLTQSQKAWWFAEGIWYKGIQYYIQKITLPDWEA